MKCPLCGHAETLVYGKTDRGELQRICPACHEIFTDRPLRNYTALSIIQSKKARYFVLLFFCIGFAINFIIANMVPYYHRSDVQVFRVWADCFFQSKLKIYLTCNTGFYPTIGMLASGGIIYSIKALTGLTDGEFINNAFRSYLFFFDILNLFLFVAIARMMRFQKPIILGLALFLIPSNIVGGAIWGQIDNISLSFCLISSIAMIKSWGELHNAKSDLKAISWLLVAALSLPIFILVKQLSAFSLPYFLVLFVVTTIKFWQKWQKKGAVYICAAIGVFFLVFYSLDHLLAVPKNFLGSSYYYIWTGGSSGHGNIISANGFNIWIFLGRDPASSSRIPFSLLWDKDAIFKVSPYDFGIALYLFWIIFLLVTTGWLTRKNSQEFNADPSSGEPKLMAVLFLYHGLSYLGFNVLLTGTHERYMYNGYPFLLFAIAWFLTQRLVFSWRITVFCFASAFIYGCFVFSIIGPLPGILFAFSRHEFLASIHLLLLILLADAWLQICRLHRV